MKLFNRRKKFQPTEQDIADMEQIGGILTKKKSKIPREIAEAHAHCSDNRSEIQKSNLCGCFYCLKVFSAIEVTEWAGDNKTAICPNCGIDSVIGDTVGFVLTRHFLEDVHKHWF